MIFHTKILHGAFLRKNLYVFSYKFKQGTFSRPKLYDFSYKIKQDAFSRKNRVPIQMYQDGFPSKYQ